jgi:hypothetical protein
VTATVTVTDGRYLTEIDLHALVTPLLRVKWSWNRKVFCSDSLRRNAVATFSGKPAAKGRWTVDGLCMAGARPANVRKL